MIIQNYQLMFHPKACNDLLIDLLIDDFPVEDIYALPCCVGWNEARKLYTKMWGLIGSVCYDML